MRKSFKSQMGDITEFCRGLRRSHQNCFPNGFRRSTHFALFLAPRPEAEPEAGFLRMLCLSTKRHPHTSGLLFAPSMRSPGLYLAIDRYTLLINADTFLRTTSRPQGSLAFSQVPATVRYVQLARLEQRATGIPTWPALLADSLLAYPESPGNGKAMLHRHSGYCEWGGRLGHRIHQTVECWVGVYPRIQPLYNGELTVFPQLDAAKLFTGNHMDCCLHDWRPWPG
ncbi:hypothetical protein BDZ85DRAFT_112819 [Elsinoe ampelina]|uniref:Uncharacterized protein n=1 Tax=Elsinoe ampelina TaxID=302913 RepID=A0A6A6GD81_9PEZI|nr:hypothetical protein BDZ85DRAFT_112819 [Elsinoe ampelina]